jgi:hypothetical protein
VKIPEARLEDLKSLGAQLEGFDIFWGPATNARVRGFNGVATYARKVPS